MSSRTKVVHCKKASYDVYIGRPSKWGNPFVISKDSSREEVVKKYREWLLGQRSAPGNRARPTLEEAKKELKGKVLGCWCSPKICHGDVLVQFLDGG